MSPDVLLLASGGLDSTTLAYWLRSKGHSPWILFFDYGQHCAEKEWSTLTGIVGDWDPRPERVSIAGLFAGSSSRMVVEADLWTEPVSDGDLYLPYRTMLFLTAAAVRAQTLGLRDVYAGFINSNHAKEIDCTASYLNGAGALVADTGAVRIQLPFRDFPKRRVAELALELGVPLGRTFSCQAMSDTPCGACPNCVERLEAVQGVWRNERSQA